MTMAKKKAFSIPKKLSDGIGQTISTANNNIGQLRYDIISLARIELDPNNPRKLTIQREDIIHGISKDDKDYAVKQNDVEKLTSLANSIKKVGVRHPIEVYKDSSNFILISGERRLLASHMAGKIDIQARILDKKPDGVELRLLQWIENIEREDLSVWEKIGNIQQISEAYSKINNTPLTSDTLSTLLGCSKKQASRYLSLLNAPDEIIQRLQNTEILDLIKLSQIVNTSDEKTRDVMISAAEKGVSREELSQLKQTNLKRASRKGKSKRGRPETLYKISTNNKMIIKNLIQCVVTNDNYMEHADRFKAVDWDSVGSVRSALKMLFDLMNTKVRV